MARARECDRCGKLYKPYIETDKSKGNAMEIYIQEERGSAVSIKCYDLCPECMAELQNWVNDEPI